jgi:hypothetical protein
MALADHFPGLRGTNAQRTLNGQNRPTDGLKERGRASPLALPRRRPARTPIQLVSDTVRFPDDAVGDLMGADGH